MLATFANCSGSGRAWRCRPGTSCRTSSALIRVPPRVAMVPAGRDKADARELVVGPRADAGHGTQHQGSDEKREDRRFLERMKHGASLAVARLEHASEGGRKVARRAWKLLYRIRPMLVGAVQPVAEVSRGFVRCLTVEGHHRGRVRPECARCGRASVCRHTHVTSMTKVRPAMILSKLCCTTVSR